MQIYSAMYNDDSPVSGANQFIFRYFEQTERSQGQLRPPNRHNKICIELISFIQLDRR
jgi:hypothetical protein